MKYYTKEWYELSQAQSIYYDLKEEKAAENFSEAYFEKIYEEKFNEWLENEEKFVMQQKECESQISIINNREIAVKVFNNMLEHNKQHFEKILPKEILEKIADIRVFSLSKASSEVINAVTEFCEDNKRKTDKISQEYKEYYKEKASLFDNNIVKNICFHDCSVIDVKEDEGLLKITFDNSGGLTDIIEMQLENYKILKQDAPLHNCYWIYEEIYKADNKYELHVLLQDRGAKLIDFIVSAEKFYFK